MPIYEYRCKQCGEVSKFLEGVGRDRPELKCVVCAGEDLERLISLPGIVKKRGDNVISELGEQGGCPGKDCIDPGWPNENFIKLKGQS